jgi:AcrR family transcriptional regulator
MMYDEAMTTQTATKKQSVNTAAPPKPYHHGDLHQEILCAACELLEEHNIASLSLRQVAKKVGVSHTAPYRHFKDKEDLLAGVAGVGFKQLTQQMAAAVAANNDDPAAQLKEAAHGYVNMALRHPQCTQLMFSGILPCDDTYPELKASGDTAFDGLKSIIEEGQSSGAFVKGDVEALALSAWATIHGLASLIISGNLEDILSISADTRQITDSVTSTMLDGLKSS